jgi:glycosyltransferase involved in cell wall biosynthesis
MNELPLVSILMTAYNREAFIAEAIESVLASTYAHFELIIVDDGSEDATTSIAKSYVQKDARIRLFINEQNLGDYANRNKAASYATGDYIMFVDSDDMILVDGIERCVHAMLQYPHAGFGMYYPQEEGTVFYKNAGDAIGTHFFKQPFLTIGPGGTIQKRTFLESIHGYPENYGPADDMYYNLKAASKAGVLLLPFNFVFYRLHEGQQLNNKYSYMINNYRYLRDALTGLDLPLNDQQKDWISKKNKRRFAVNIIKYFLTTFNLRKTRDAIRQTAFKTSDFVKGIFHQ